MGAVIPPAGEVRYPRDEIEPEQDGPARCKCCGQVLPPEQQPDHKRENILQRLWRAPLGRGY